MLKVRTSKRVGHEMWQILKELHYNSENCKETRLSVSAYLVLLRCNCGNFIPLLEEKGYEHEVVCSNIDWVSDDFLLYYTFKAIIIWGH